jgi:nicotinamidase-related amidase
MHALAALLSVNFIILAATFFTPNLAAAKVDTATTAAVVVDMQQGFYDRGGVSGTIGLQRLVDRQTDLLKWAVKEKVPVLIFEYKSFGPTDPRLTSLLAGHQFIRVIKENDDGFTMPSVKRAVKFLTAKKIKTLIMSGINGAYCVHDTAKGAIAKGYDVVTSSDIVGNLNENPPIYPNNTWYFKNNKLDIYANLDAILY